MRISYRGNEYELTELYEPNSNATFDIIAIFRVQYCVWSGLNLIEVSKDLYDKTDDKMEKLSFVDYFYGAEDFEENLIEEAKKRIKECEG